MAQPMKLSILIGADASGAKAGSAEAQRALGTVSKAANDAGASINRLIGETTGLNRAFASVDTRGADIAAYGAQLDALRARYNPMFATISRYKAEVEGIRAAHRVGAISSAEMTAAISRERQATLASIDAIKGRNTAVRSMQAANRNVGNRFETANIAAQFQDIGVTAAMGMDPLQIALQQGTQLSAVLGPMGAGGAARGLAAAFTSIISPVSLLTIGTVGLGAAAIQYFSSAESGAEKVNSLLDAQNEVIRRAAAAWGDAAPALQAYVAQLDGVAKLAAGREATELLAGRELEGLAEKISGINQEFMGAVRSLNQVEADPKFITEFRLAFSDLREKLDDGKATIGDVTNAQRLMGEAVANYGTKEVKALKLEFDQLTGSINTSVAAAQKIRDEFIKGIAGGTNVQDIVAANTFRDNEGNLRFTESFTPRNPGVPTERPSDLDFDPNAEATKKLNALLEENAQRIEQQRDATRDYLTTQNDSIARIQLEMSLIGASVSERSKAIAAFEAEQKIRELGIMTMGREAEMIRANAQARAELQLQLERQQAAYGAVQQAGSTMIDQLTVGTGTLKDRLKGMAETLLTTFQQLAVANPLKNMLLGTNLPTLTDLFSGKTASPIGATTTGAMTVTAGTVMINGVPLSGLTNPLAAANSNIPTAANQNSAISGLVNDPSLASRVSSAAAPAGSIEAYIRNSAVQRGIDPNVAVAVAKSEGGLTSWNAQSQVFKNGVQEQSYGPFQMYMGGGLGNRFQNDTGLDPRLAVNGPAATDYALDVASKEGWGAWYGAKKAGISNWEGINPPVPDTSAATNALKQLSTTTTTAATNVTSMATGAVDATQGLGGLTGGISKLFSGLFGGLFADGAAFSGGSVIAFANGGVVGGPTMFAMSGGRMGLMGEAGPEAIMPLARGGDGKLGVRASIPRGARQGNELRMRYENHSTLQVLGTGDKELLAQAEAGVRLQIEESENRIRNSMPDMINDFQQNRWARTSG